MINRLIGPNVSIAVVCALLAATGCGGRGDSGAKSSGGPSGDAGTRPPTPSNAGDKYVGVGTNPFVATAHDPLSTFAVDVDTASYDIFRRDVNLGTLPQPDSVRLEEYVNDFRYDYPVPAASDPDPFRISLGAAADMFARGTTLLRVGIQGYTPPASEKRPANLAFLVDVSGSMASADKLPLVQRILRNALEILDPTDKVSIVTYSATAQVRLAATPA